MNLVTWNPWRNMRTLHDRMNQMIDNDFFPSTWLDEGSGLSRWNPAVDIFDNGDKIVLKAELPGVDKENIEVDLKDNILTLQGERNNESEVKEENYYRKERTYGRFERSFSLSGDLDPDKVSAEYKDGVLRIEIPKSEEKKPRKIDVH